MLVQVPLSFVTYLANGKEDLAQGIYFFIYAQNPNLTPNWLLLLSLADEFLYYVLAYYALLFVKFSYLSRFHGFLVFVILY